MSEDTLVKQFVDAATKPLLAEIDRLRAELEKAQSGPAWDLSQKRAVEIIELRAELEALREAGDGLEAQLSLYPKDQRSWYVDLALNLWRKAKGEK